MAILKEADLNGDGVIDINDFFNMMYNLREKPNGAKFETAKPEAKITVPLSTKQ